MNTVTVNGVAEQLTQPCSLGELLAQRGISAEQTGIAVALNERVVPRQQWATAEVKPGDRLEVVTARQGG